MEFWKKKWHKHQADPITEAQEATILSDFDILTDSKIKSNEPNIVVKYYKRKICLLIDMSEWTDNNISIKKYNKINKYKILEIEIEKT